MIDSHHLSCTSAAAEHLIDDKEYIVLVADLPDSLIISVRRRNACQGCSADGLTDEGRNSFSASASDFRFQRIGAFKVALAAFLSEPAAVAVRRRDMAFFLKLRYKFSPAGDASAPAQGVCGKSVIALPPADDLIFHRLAFLRPVDARQLRCDLVGFRTAGYQEESIHTVHLPPSCPSLLPKPEKS